MVSILPSIFHGLLCNGAQLQLIECIESIKSDVKKKMMRSRACDPHTKVTRGHWRRKFCEREQRLRSFFLHKIFGGFWSVTFAGSRKRNRQFRKCRLAVRE